MKDPKIDLDMDKNFNATLLITCGSCSRKTKVPLKQATPNKKIKCSCGDEFILSGDDLRKMQKSFDDLNRTLKKFGK